MENLHNFPDNWETEEDDMWDEEPDTIETRELFEPTQEDEYSFEGNEFFDDAVLDMDYSMFKGNFKHSLGKIKHKIKHAPRKRKKPLSKDFEVGDKSTTTISGGRKQIGKIIIPKDRQVSIEGVEHFMLSKTHDTDSIKNIGYYQGKKLKELVLSINNTTGSDFMLELFNPSMPLDYLQSTSGNLNDRLAVAGASNVTYSDLLHNLLANPTLIANARFICTGPSVNLQKTEKLTFLNKAIDGESTVKPLQLNLNQDLYQLQNDVILFDIIGQLNRVFIPDGMDIIQYTVLAGMSVTFCFYYKQKSLKKLMWKEARKKTIVAGELRGLL